MLNNIKNALYRFMQGRYGADQFNNFLLMVAVLLALINSFFIRSPFFGLFVDAILIYSLFRMFSKNIWKRQKENLKYMEMTRPVRTRFNLIKRNMTDKEHRYFICPNCKQTVRVPRGRGKIEITCPRCKTKFEKKS